jgi:hypothetical protein
MKRQCLSIESLPAWARLNGIEFPGVAFDRFPHSEGGTLNKGTSVIVKEEKSSAGLTGDQSFPLMLIRVPPDLILSLQSVKSYAKSDRYLREVLEAVGDFGRVRLGCLTIAYSVLFPIKVGIN